MLPASTPQCTDRFLKGKNHRCNIETNLYNHPLIDKTQLLPKPGRVPKRFSYLLSKSQDQPLRLASPPSADLAHLCFSHGPSAGGSP